MSQLLLGQRLPVSGDLISRGYQVNFIRYFDFCLKCSHSAKAPWGWGRSESNLEEKTKLKDITGEETDEKIDKEREMGTYLAKIPEERVSTHSDVAAESVFTFRAFREIENLKEEIDAANVEEI